MEEMNLRKHDEKKKRIEDALNCREPDRVPIDIEGGRFMVNYAGFQMKDIIYDTSFEVYKACARKFLKDFDPDVVCSASGNFYGEGPAYEMTKGKTIIVAGQNDPRVNDNSIHQFVEFPCLRDEEFDEFFSDRTKWILNKFLPRISDVFEPFKTFNIDPSHRGISNVAKQFAAPDIRKAMQELWDIADAYSAVGKKAKAAEKEMIELGYPSMGGGVAAAPFDKYSDTFRGTLLSLTDLYEMEEEVLRYCDEFHQQQLNRIRNMNRDGRFNGKYVQMMLHKGVDGFMDDAHYERFYWRYLEEIIRTVREAGMIPMLFAEGKYFTRLKFLERTPTGPALYRFETIDMALAKAKLGGKVCIGGGFPSPLLSYGTRQQVVEETKKLLDQVMKGGGYIFRCSAGLDCAKTDNVIAMFETVKEYGKY